MLDTSILIVISQVLQIEPDKVIEEGEEDTEDQGTEGPFLDFICIVEHKDSGSTDGQIKEIGTEKEHADC